MRQSLAINEFERLRGAGLSVPRGIHLIPNGPAQSASQAAARNPPFPGVIARRNRGTCHTHGRDDPAPPASLPRADLPRAILTAPAGSRRPAQTSASARIEAGAI